MHAPGSPGQALRDCQGERQRFGGERLSDGRMSVQHRHESGKVSALDSGLIFGVSSTGKRAQPHPGVAGFAAERMTDGVSERAGRRRGEFSLGFTYRWQLSRSSTA